MPSFFWFLCISLCISLYSIYRLNINTGDAYHSLGVRYSCIETGVGIREDIAKRIKGAQLPAKKAICKEDAAEPPTQSFIPGTI